MNKKLFRQAQALKNSEYIHIYTNMQKIKVKKTQKRANVDNFLFKGSY